MITQQDIDDEFKTRGIDPGTGQSLLSQRLAAQQSAPSQNQSFVNQLANAPGTQAVLGAGDAMRHLLTNAMNLVPGVNIPFSPSGQGTAYNIGKVGGDVASYMLGGEALGAARLGAEALPYVGDIARGIGQLPGAVQRTIGAALYGGIQSPENRGAGAATGAGISAALEAVPYLGSASQFIRPQQYAENILNTIKGEIQKSNAMYKPVQDAVNKNNIYQGEGLPPSEYAALPDDITDSFDRKISSLHDDFLNDPTFENAHALQSQIGSTIGKLQGQDAKGTLSMADRRTMQGYQQARSALKNDMMSYLQNVDPDLASQYSAATQNYAQNVAPYFSGTQLSEIINKPGNVNAEQLASAFRRAKNKSPAMLDQLQTINNRINLRNLMQRGAGAMVGGALGSSLGAALPYAMEGGAVAGGMIAPAIARAAQNAIPNMGAATSAVSGMAASAYPFIKNALISQVGGNQ